MDKLAAQVSILAAQVAMLASNAEGSAALAHPNVAQRVSTAAQSVAAETGQATPTKAQQETVFLQFAGVPRSKVDLIGAGLRDAEFNVPGEERTDAAASGMFDVRYFWVSDKDLAINVAHVAETVAAGQLSDPRQAKVVDLTSWPNTKPRQGSVELWYSPP